MISLNRGKILKIEILENKELGCPVTLVLGQSSLCTFYLFIIYFWLHWVFVAACGFLWLRRAGATLRCGARASHCSGFSCCRAQALGAQASVVVVRGLSSCGSWALECRLSTCGTRAQPLRGMWDLPRPGLEPLSPALAGRFSTTAPPGKPLTMYFLI